MNFRPVTESRCNRDHSSLEAEHLAQWYLRLNGFMTMNDFVLHRDHKPWGQRTDADIFGVRFPFRRELNFEDDAPFLVHRKPYFVIAEITRGECKLNGPWTKPERENMQYVLLAIGAFEPEKLDEIARSLYERYCFEDSDRRIELVAFGKQASPRYSDPAKALMQVEFGGVCHFIYKRFSRYLQIKKDHQHWDYAGQALWDLAEHHWNSEEVFVKEALNVFGLTTA